RRVSPSTLRYLIRWTVFFVELVEADFLAFRRGGEQRDRTGDEGQFQIALSVRTRGNCSCPVACAASSISRNRRRNSAEITCTIKRSQNSHGSDKPHTCLLPNYCTRERTGSTRTKPGPARPCPS